MVTPQSARLTKFDPLRQRFQNSARVDDIEATEHAALVQQCA